MTDARDRRRQHMEASHKADPMAAMKKYKVPLIIFLVWGLIIGYNVAVAEGVIGEANADCPGHWHAGFDVVVDGQKVQFTDNPAYTLEGGDMGIRTHMHRGSEGIWHFEPPRKTCTDLADAMDELDLSVTDTAITLSGNYHESRGWGGTHIANETSQVQVFQRDYGQEWRSVDPSSTAGRQAPNGAQILITFGDYSEAELDALKASATPFPANLAPQPNDEGGLGDRFVPIMAVTLFAAVALFIWNGMRQKAN